MTRELMPEARPRALVLTINYAPEPTGFAPHVTSYCEHLASQGWRVTVLTGFPFAPKWKRWPEYRGRLIEDAVLNGVRVIRNTHFIPRRPRSMIQRLLMEGTFCLGALFAGAGFRPRADVILYVGAQPSVAMLARLLGFLTRRPFGVMINDIASGAARDVGIVKAGTLARILEAFEYRSYLSAAGAVVLCEAFKQSLIARGYPAERVRVIRSPVDVENIRPVLRRQEVRAAFGLAPDDFVVLFAGSMGLKQGLPDVVRAAAAARSSLPRLRWILIGDGEMRPVAEEMVRKLELGGCVQLAPFQPEEALADVFAMADVLLLNQLASVKDTVVPSKLLTYMAAGRPVIAAINRRSQGAEILEGAGGGVVVEPESPAALVTGLEFLWRQRAQLGALGEKNRAYAIENFDQREVNRKLEAFTQELTRC